MLCIWLCSFVHIGSNRLLLDEDSLPRRCARKGAASSAKIAVAFFGMSRNLRSTLPSIERHVFEVLERNNIQYDVFWHTMAAKVVRNNRTDDNEFGRVDPFDVRLMRPCIFSLTDQETTKAHEFNKFLKARKIKDPMKEVNRYPYDTWWDEYVSVKNMLCAMFTQASLADMINSHAQLHNIKYDAIIALRPDTGVIKDIDLPTNIETIRHDPMALWLPAFQHWYGYNDRAAFGSVHVMQIYLRRGIEYRDSEAKQTGEEYVKFTAEKYNFTLHWSDIRVVRVRQDGRVSHRDMPYAMNISQDPLDSDFKRCVPDLESRVLSPLC